ncbi:putative phosphotransferase [Burkholderiales bacterium GJ-E10]|nr:putative phosphotransferase [Burkholderiales bacterium GJ-E10]
MADRPETLSNPDMPHEDSPPQDLRLDALRTWLASLPATWNLDPASLRPASSDASFRRYFRVDRRSGDGSAAGDRSWIVMDAPPQHEDCRPFLFVADLLARQGVRAPAVLERNLEHGFLLLRDLGDTTYADAIASRPERIPDLYEGAIAALVRMQGIPVAGTALPPYDRDRLLAEMRLFPEWYVARHLGIDLSPAERAVLDAACERLAASALDQAQVFVHRDYHSRNLMAPDADGGSGPQQDRTPDSAVEPGVLDFQDAVIGPITYDLVSLLRDAYVEWPEPQQIDWAARYWERARRQGLPVPADFGRFWRDLEWMGLQRSLKVLGIFARLHHRDGKDRYLADLPVVLRHAQRVVERYDPFAALARLLDRIHGRAREEGYTF